MPLFPFTPVYCEGPSSYCPYLILHQSSHEAFWPFEFHATALNHIYSASPLIFKQPSSNSFYLESMRDNTVVVFWLLILSSQLEWPQSLFSREIDSLTIYVNAVHDLQLTGVGPASQLKLSHYTLGSMSPAVPLHILLFLFLLHPKCQFFTLSCALFSFTYG